MKRKRGETKRVTELQWDCLQHLHMFWKDYSALTPSQQQRFLQTFAESDPSFTTYAHLVLQKLARIKTKILFKHPLSDLEKALIAPIITRDERMELALYPIPSESSGAQIREKVKQALDNAKLITLMTQNMMNDRDSFSRFLAQDFRVSDWTKLPIFSRLIEKAIPTEAEREKIRLQALKWLSRTGRRLRVWDREIHPHHRLMTMQDFCDAKKNPELIYKESDSKETDWEKKYFRKFCKEYHSVSCLRDITPNLLYAPDSAGYLQTKKTFQDKARFQEEFPSFFKKMQKYREGTSPTEE